jgi:hypothetical protein
MRDLYFLDLSKNLLSGELPDCWMNYSHLEVLILGSNKLTGNIPSSLGSLFALEWLSLNKNNLSGDLPLSLQNCKYLKLSISVRIICLAAYPFGWEIVQPLLGLLCFAQTSFMVVFLKSSVTSIHFKSWTLHITNYQDPFHNALVI